MTDNDHAAARNAARRDWFAFGLDGLSARSKFGGVGEPACAGPTRLIKLTAAGNLGTKARQRARCWHAKPACEGRRSSFDPAAFRIVDLRHQGRQIADDAWFIVATNNYRAGGGGNFSGIDGSNVVFETTQTEQEILKDWLIAQGTIDARNTPNCRFAPIAAPVDVVFESSPAARAHLVGQSRISDAGDAPNGIALFRLEVG